VISLDDPPSRYPLAPGFRDTDTSRAAAESMRDSAAIRGAVLRCFEARGPMTADECAAQLRLSLLTVRPRVTELKHLGMVRDTGVRRPNASGRNAIVWWLAGRGDY
jgi:predicted ArsR family transcriptional regulator